MHASCCLMHVPHVPACTRACCCQVRVLVSQRDRFRAKAQELEELLTKSRADLGSAKSEVAAVRADNIALIERLK